jgi:outer membrane protein assembly factor BamB
VQASGIAEGKGLPLTWDSAIGENIRWKTPVPGLGHSAPSVWGNRVFLTTAVNTESTPLLRTDMGGATNSHDEPVAHHFRVYCLNLESGKIIWERTAHTGIPQVKRHAMSSHANSTPATDGKHVVAFFGSEGLYCYDFDGKLLWKADLGYLDATWFHAPDDQWGFGSSPIIHEGKVIVVCDVHNQSFITAFDVANGRELWRTLRDEIPGWGSPTVHTSEHRSQVVVNGFKHIGGYDLETGKALWWMKGGGDIPVPTPIVAHGLAFITNSHGRMRPIYAIRLDATGDISLANGETANDDVVWSKPRRGAYMPTPIVVGDYLYVGNDSGVLTCYRATTGEQIFSERIGGKQARHVGSAVSGAGRNSYKQLGTGSLNGVCLSTPAIAGSTLLVRTSTHLYSIGDTGGKPGVKDQPKATLKSPM